MHYIRESATLGNKELIFETGRMAKQAGGSILVQQGDTVVLVTVVGGGERPDLPFFPLVCDYVEKSYAAGRIPGSFFRREGRLGEHEILACRLIDRPIRPLFADGYMGNTQVTATVLSADGQNPADVLAITGASAALMISDLPWVGPLAGVRVGRVDGNFVANPTTDEREAGDLDLIMACSHDNIVMVEGESDGITEADLLAAMKFGLESVRRVLDLQLRLQEIAGKDKRESAPPTIDEKVLDKVKSLAVKPITAALEIRQKLARYAALDACKKEVVAAAKEAFPDQEGDIKDAFAKVKKDTMRQITVKSGKRIDGRDYDQVRGITTEVAVLPRTHGSALFTRGETQTLVTVTFGTDRMNQKLESLDGTEFRNFMLHYNFPPFSVGEVRPLRGPGRREIGHGMLARRAIIPMLPEKEEFPYVIRIVSEVLESNGSSSMATVCGGSMALMDAGVPVKDAVAGIAMGLIKEGDDMAILSDILGDEDHLGDMDFKVAGTREHVTAIQMDTKISGISDEVMSRALEQARRGRVHILDEMAKTLATPRDDIAPHAPRIINMRIKPDRIRDLIGPGGKNIRGIQEVTGVDINVSDDGTVQIASAEQSAADQAIKMVKGLTMEPEVGAIYHGVVAKVVDFGAFISITPSVDGLCHVSEISDERVENVSDVLREGDEVIVKCIGLERGGKVKLSRREALGKKPTHSLLDIKSKTA